MEYIAFDSHRHYTLARVESADGQRVREVRIDHERGGIRGFLRGCELGSGVALETIGTWYWIVDEIEEAGMTPRLVQARKAKLMMGSINKTDRLDAKGLNLLQRNDTLPTVWIPPGELRDHRELPRTRMVLTAMRTRLKNRIHSNVAKYGYKVEASDIFSGRGLEQLRQVMGRLPTQTRFASELLLEELEGVAGRIRMIENRMKEMLKLTPEMELIMSLPGVGFILAAVILLEAGDVSRYSSAGQFASYAGTTPRVHSSGGKTRYGSLRSDVNRYLKWAYVEAANVVSAHAGHWPHRHVAQLYSRLRKAKGHQKAVGAVARHLAEATFWMLTKKEAYKNPVQREPVSSMGA